MGSRPNKGIGVGQGVAVFGEMKESLPTSSPYSFGDVKIGNLRCIKQTVVTVTEEKMTER